MVMSVDLFNPLQHVQRSKHNLNDVLYAANHSRVYICMCVCMCMYMCVYVCVYICVYVMNGGKNN